MAEPVLDAAYYRSRYRPRADLTEQSALKYQDIRSGRILVENYVEPENIPPLPLNTCHIFIYPTGCDKRAGKNHVQPNRVYIVNHIFNNHSASGCEGICPRQNGFFTGVRAIRGQPVNDFPRERCLECLAEKAATKARAEARRRGGKKPDESAGKKGHSGTGSHTGVGKKTFDPVRNKFT